ncbi:AraC family transcriptional regulator [Achromobacter spanius]|uniref:AraC family transcriptional regulator n=1 Tax=Achromobacter spanius TaxID=217203 RepID=UPI000F8FA0D4|nr:AraC family transcriptional regulator [Achromobacter spanius]AZS81316.1 AraC family transcriptional regulator [Achromobacter spanius]
MPSGQFLMHRSALAGVQAVAARSRHAFARHTHDQFGIGVMRQGAQVSHSGRGQVRAGPGHVITVNPGEVHDGVPIGDTPRAWQMLYLDPDVVAQAANDLAKDGYAGACYEFEHPAQHQPALARDVLALYSHAIGAAAPLACDALLLRILVQARGDGGRWRVAAAGPGMPAGIRHARSLIDDAPAATLSLADLAAACGLSRYQTLRAFARATGMTPHAYQIQRRLLLARQLIRRGMTLADAAAASGFADQSHMTRLFVRTYGVSPGCYAMAARLA